MNIKDVWTTCLTDCQNVLTQFMDDPIQIEKCETFSQMLMDTFNNDGKVMSCGNGGSHCDAMHFAEELTGRYRDDRRPLGALALGDSSHVTCVSNDYGFEYIFERQVAALGRPGDLLIGLSTSGNSENVIRAFTKAEKMDIRTVALLGKGGGKLKDLADLSIVVPAQTSDRIQEVHIKVLHTVIETLERQLFPANYEN